jgi:hypothetical protein
MGLSFRRLRDQKGALRGTLDVQPIIQDLIQGRAPGDQIPGIGYEVFKVRAKSSDRLQLCAAEPAVRRQKDEEHILPSSTPQSGFSAVMRE